jgi:hypothetical protein
LISSSCLLLPKTKVLGCEMLGQDNLRVAQNIE